MRPKTVAWQALALAGLALTLAAAAVSPAAADRSDSGRSWSRDRQVAEFEIEAALCGDGSAPTGAAVGSIGLVTGDLMIELRTRPGRTGDRSGARLGRWELDPSSSTGALRGWVVVDGRGRAQFAGRGTGALRGTVIRGWADLATDASCDGGISLTGSGRASRLEPEAPVGAVQVAGTKSVDQAVADLTSAIDANPNLTLVRAIDHAAAAASRGLDLGPTVELFFGNPAIGTPLMQSSQTTGIDLPQKILIWEDLLGSVRVAYNAPAYLQSRHGIEGADAQLGTVANALAALAGVAAGTTVEPTFDAGRVPEGAGLVTVESSKTPEDAFADIVAALEAAGPVNVAIVLEHDANAARVGLELDPTKLVVFGNPSLGTGLMQTQRSVAIDLPQKILVHAPADGPTLITWNDPHWVAARHGITGQDAVLDTLAGALADFADAGR